MLDDRFTSLNNDINNHGKENLSKHFTIFHLRESVS